MRRILVAGLVIGSLSTVRRLWRQRWGRGVGEQHIEGIPGPAGRGRHVLRCFGQTAHFTSTAGSNDIPLEFTVSSPKKFTPSKDATVFDALAAAGAQPGKLKATNIYFTVTIKNTSTTQSWDADFVFGHVDQTGNDEEISEVHDGDIDSTFSLDDIPPGKSASFKDGFSVQSASKIQYELDVDGLAGKSFYWTK